MLQVRQLAFLFVTELTELPTMSVYGQHLLGENRSGIASEQLTESEDTSKFLEVSSVLFNDILRLSV